MRNLRRGVEKVKAAIAACPNRAPRAALNGYSAREMVDILALVLTGESLTSRRASRCAREEKQLQFGFMAATTPTDSPQS